MITLRPALIALVALLAAAPAGATSYLDGFVQFFQNQGNFCPTTRSCTGANYVEAQFHTNQPLVGIKVQLVDESTGQLLGQGVTGTNGHALISFPDPFLGQRGFLRIPLAEGSGRWSITDMSGAGLTRQSVGFYLQQRSQQSPATHQVTLGTLVSPDAEVNVFDAASRAWRFALAQSAPLVTRFTDVRIKTFSNPLGNECPTSCARGSASEIVIDSNRPFEGFTVLHEMGHMANYFSHAGGSWAQGVCYTFPNHCSVVQTVGDWFLDGPEWSSAGFEEALASFDAAAALYQPSASAPHICPGRLSSCITGTFNLESLPSCASEQRNPLTQIRYFWDVYDNHADSLTNAWPPAPFPQENQSTPLATMLGALGSYPAGVGNHAEDEPSGPGELGFRDDDGRSLVDYREYVLGSDTLFTFHCTPPGD